MFDNRDREVHIHHHGHMTIELKSDIQSEQLRQIMSTLQQILQKEIHMAGELDALIAAVAAESTVVDSAIVLLDDIKSLLDAAIASGDPARLAALSAEIEAKRSVLADAVVRNTPAAPSARS